MPPRLVALSYIRAENCLNVDSLVKTMAVDSSSLLLQDYLAMSGLSYALLRPCNFYENMINFTFYQKQDDGPYAFSDNMGTAPHAWHSVSTIGLYCCR